MGLPEDEQDSDRLCASIGQVICHQLLGHVLRGRAKVLGDGKKMCAGVLCGRKKIIL